MRAERSLVALVIAALAAVPGCGGGSTTTTAPTEVAQKLPKHPSRWKAHRDRSIGYAIRLPPGWQLRSRAGTVLIRSPDHLVAVTLAVNRNPVAFTVPPDQYATRALAALPGFEQPLKPHKPRPFGGTPLDAAQTSAPGTTKARGLRERVTLVVLRRGEAVNYTLAVIKNSRRGYSSHDRAVALRMLRTLRDQPVEPPVPPKSQ